MGKNIAVLDIERYNVLLEKEKALSHIESSENNVARLDYGDYELNIRMIGKASAISEIKKEYKDRMDRYYKDKRVEDRMMLEKIERMECEAEIMRYHIQSANQELESMKHQIEKRKDYQIMLNRLNKIPEWIVRLFN